ncbi:MBL fold metallo-hydrolase [Sphaerisporangium rubeum]|uniref:Glyoxylase-like metal-dependent hydrolase (Beta-lactamase superfamily II) n=1 Tax=Sphaerisporangium rubeum TaxID=321317 RepID=A0A7X0IIU8_9ACTN|nr:glyoxylase-like metal-dependent hydrolase (beta-lactamase superfamily II) [Sphaerisporangium rubeum]
MKTRRRPYSDQRPTGHGGGVWSVPVPIPGNPLGYTLVYAVESPGGIVLIDAGWNHEDAWTALRDGLSAVGVRVSDLRGVVVTHYHPDHAGLAGRVREECGGWIAMHEADAALVRLYRELAGDSGRTLQVEMMRRAGAGADADAMVNAERPIPPAQPDIELRDGELIDLPGRALRTVWTPGHTPGHLCLHLEDADRLFTGDHVLPGITPHVGIYPYDRADTDPLTDFLGSLDRLATFTTTEALPAHEWTFKGVAARAADIRAHHEEKLDSLAALLTDLAPDAYSIWQIAEKMTWNRPWADLYPIQRGMAAGEAAAHLRTLETRGQALRHPGEPVRFSAP